MLEIKLISDELFILAGLIASNMDNSEQYISFLKQYQKEGQAHKIELTRKQLDDIIKNVSKLHKSQKGTTLKLLTKLDMYREICVEEERYTSTIKNIRNKYKNKIFLV